MHKEALERILIRGPNWVGDAVMSEPALSAVRRHFGGAEISLLVKPPIAELFANHPAVDRILVYDDRGCHAGLSGKWTLAGILRRHRFNLAILFQNAFEAAFLTLLAGIPRRYGYTTDGRGLLLTEPVSVPKRGLLAHQVHYYWELLKALGVQGEPETPRLHVSPQEEQAMARRLAAEGVRESDLVVGINPGSTYGSAKRWLPERYAETVNRLVDEQRARSGAAVCAVLVGAKGEESLGRSIAAKIKARSVVLSGRTTVRELMAAIKRCRLFLTNDTGPMHIAASFNIPLVAVFGPTDWQLTAPFGAGHRLVREAVACAPCLLRECPIDHRCMTGVTVNHVHEAAMNQLMQRHQPSVVAHEPLVVAQDASHTTHHLTLEGITVFLDRDGTLNRDKGFIRGPDELEVFPDVARSLARIKQAGGRLIVVSNQSGVGRGLMSLKDVEEIHTNMRAALEKQGAALDAIYFCPHHPDDGCLCRKPGRGMIDRAVAELKVSLVRAYVLGDKALDVELAKGVGARSILVMTGPSSPQALIELKDRGVTPDFVAGSLTAAVDWMMEDVVRQVECEVRPHLH